MTPSARILKGAILKYFQGSTLLWRTGSTRAGFSNGYRVKEAVRIISQKGREELHINDVYECVGFTNRTTFYRVFKQFTGLSPLEFQKSHESGEK